jgi:galactokinase
LIKKLVKSSGDMSPISQLKKENNDLISDDYEKACLLNNYFCSISTLNDSKMTSRILNLNLKNHLVKYIVKY